MTDPRPLCLGGCGRRLTDPTSVARGYGKVCAERHGVPTRTRTARAHRTPTIPVHASSEQIPGQTELPLVYREVTLWSL